MKLNVFRLVPSESRTDTTFIQVGKELKRFIVITNDLFKEYKWLRLHRVGVGLQYPNNTPYLAIDSVKSLIYAFYGKQYKIKPQKEKNTIILEGKIHA